MYKRQVHDGRHERNQLRKRYYPWPPLLTRAEEAASKRKVPLIGAVRVVVGLVVVATEAAVEKDLVGSGGGRKS